LPKIQRSATSLPILLTPYRDTAGHSLRWQGRDMAFRLGLGNFLGRFLGRIPGVLRLRWGVRGSLFAAFAVIAAMAIIISAGAGLGLRHLVSIMVALSGQNIPRLAASLELSTRAASLAAQGPALLASQSEDALNERIKKLKEIQSLTQQKLGEIIELGA